MKKDRIYIDTSVVGGYYDVEFEEITKMLFYRLQNKEAIFVVSDLLDLELQSAPKIVRDLLFEFPNECFERVELDLEAKELGEMYVKEKVVGKTSIEDCYHIAMATINNVDVLASWNFKHIVNLTRIKGYNAVNLKNGYNLLEIRNPKDLVEYDKE